MTVREIEREIRKTYTIGISETIERLKKLDVQVFCYRGIKKTFHYSWIAKIDGKFYGIHQPGYYGMGTFALEPLDEILLKEHLNGLYEAYNEQIKSSIEAKEKAILLESELLNFMENADFLKGE